MIIMKDPPVCIKIPLSLPDRGTVLLPGSFIQGLFEWTGIIAFKSAKRSCKMGGRSRRKNRPPALKLFHEQNRIYAEQDRGEANADGVCDGRGQAKALFRHQDIGHGDR